MISNFSGVDLLSLDVLNRKESKVKNRVNFAEIDEEVELVEKDAASDFSSECLSRSLTPNSPSGTSNVEAFNAI